MKKLLLCLVLGIILLAFTGCENPTPTTKKVAKPTISVPAPQPLTAEEISSNLKLANLPIGNVIVYTEDNDVNKLLGRPNQYISKVNFADTTLEQIDAEDPDGGSIETFRNPADLTARKDYIEAAEKEMPALVEYMVVNGNYLLRLNHGLTPTQVDGYKEAFMKLE